MAGKLDRVAGVVVGEMEHCDWREERPEAPRTRSLEDVLELCLGPLGVPVLYKLPLGHGKHLATIPLGVSGDDRRGGAHAHDRRTGRTLRERKTGRNVTVDGSRLREESDEQDASDRGQRRDGRCDRGVAIDGLGVRAERERQQLGVLHRRHGVQVHLRRHRASRARSTRWSATWPRTTRCGP